MVNIFETSKDVEDIGHSGYNLGPILIKLGKTQVYMFSILSFNFASCLFEKVLLDSIGTYAIGTKL